MVAVVRPSPEGRLTPPMYDSMFLYQSGIKKDAGFGVNSFATSNALVNIIFANFYSFNVDKDYYFKT